MTKLRQVLSLKTFRPTLRSPQHTAARIKLQAVEAAARQLDTWSQVGSTCSGAAS